MEEHKINNGGPAFPESVAVSPSGDLAYGFGGMTLRDWFAGQALSGLLAANPEATTWSGDAENAYRAADAMIAERSKQ